jgi:hypothetical protein
LRRDKIVRNSTPHDQPNSVANSGQWLIAFGLAILIGGSRLPFVPMLTAMALITLGTTRITVCRFGRQSVFEFLLLGHLGIYFALYVLFLGALWHSPTSNLVFQPSMSHMADLAVSAGTMAVVLRTSFAALRQRSRGSDATPS